MRRTLWVVISQRARHCPRNVFSRWKRLWKVRHWGPEKVPPLMRGPGRPVNLMVSFQSHFRPSTPRYLSLLSSCITNDWMIWVSLQNFCSLSSFEKYDVIYPPIQASTISGRHGLYLALWWTISSSFIKFCVHYSLWQRWLSWAWSLIGIRCKRRAKPSIIELYQ